MKIVVLFLFLSVSCFAQTNDIILTSVSHPIQKELYPKRYWNSWVKDLPITESSIKNPKTPRTVREQEFFNRFLVYAKMQTNQPEELLSVFMDSYNYEPHYTVSEYTSVIPLKGPEYGYMWDNYSREKIVLDSICRQVLLSYDSRLIEQLQEVKTKDQYYRGQIAEKTLEGLKADGSWEKQLIFDKENSEKIKEILDRIGYPGRSTVGYENESTVFLVIQHSNLELMEYGLPFVQKAISNLDLDSTYYAYLYDRIQLVKNLPQRYGTQYNLDGTLYQLADPESVNKRRKEHGLWPIKY